MIKTIKRLARPYVLAIIESTVAYFGVWLWCHFVLHEKMDLGLWASTIAVMLLIRYYQDRTPPEPKEDEEDDY